MSDYRVTTRVGNNLITDKQTGAQLDSGGAGTSEEDESPTLTEEEKEELDDLSLNDLGLDDSGGSTSDSDTTTDSTDTSIDSIQDEDSTDSTNTSDSTVTANQFDSGGGGSTDDGSTSDSGSSTDDTTDSGGSTDSGSQDTNTDEPDRFTADIVEVSSKNLKEGESATFTIEGKNIGDDRVTRTYPVVVNGDQVNTVTFTADPGSIDTQTVDIRFDNPGTFDVGVKYGVDRNLINQVTVSVEGTAPEFVYPSFNISDQNPTVGDLVEVDLTVRNEGDESGSVDVNLVVNGDLIEQNSVNLSPGQSETVSSQFRVGSAGNIDGNLGEFDFSITAEEQQESGGGDDSGGGGGGEAGGSQEPEPEPSPGDDGGSGPDNGGSDGGSGGSEEPTTDREVSFFNKAKNFAKENPALVATAGAVYVASRRRK